MLPSTSVSKCDTNLEIYDYYNGWMTASCESLGLAEADLGRPVDKWQPASAHYYAMVQIEVQEAATMTLHIGTWASHIGCAVTLATS